MTCCSTRHATSDTLNDEGYDVLNEMMDEKLVGEFTVTVHSQMT